MKKAQGAQFNWIFIIVAGAIILGFFALFTVKFINLQQQKGNFMVAKNIENNIRILKTSSTSLFCDTSASDLCFSLGEKTYLEFYCQDKKNKLKVNKATDHELRGESVYAPNIINSKDLSFWVDPWNFPFHISNLLIISDPQKKFYLIYDQNSEDFVNLLDIPVIFKVEKISISQISQIVPKSRIVFITSSEPSNNLISKLKSQKNIISYINPSSHKLKYYDEEKDLNYLGDTQLLASIFSESASSYECNLEISKEELKQISKVYQLKARHLSQFSPQDCFYAQIHNTLKDFSENPTYELSELIASQNDNLRDNGCKEVF